VKRLWINILLRCQLRRLRRRRMRRLRRLKRSMKRLKTSLRERE